MCWLKTAQVFSLSVPEVRGPTQSGWDFLTLQVLHRSASLSLWLPESCAFFGSRLPALILGCPMLWASNVPVRVRSLHLSPTGDLMMTSDDLAQATVSTSFLLTHSNFDLVRWCTKKGIFSDLRGLSTSILCGVIVSNYPHGECYNKQNCILISLQNSVNHSFIFWLLLIF